MTVLGTNSPGTSAGCMRVCAVGAPAFAELLEHAAHLDHPYGAMRGAPPCPAHQRALDLEPLPPALGLGLGVHGHERKLWH
eukprot:1435680-Rhodomonas_salina.1